MKTLKIEGFTVNTTLDEQGTFNRCLLIENYGQQPDENEVIKALFEEIDGSDLFHDFLEKVVVGGQTAKDFYFENRHGYKDSRLEPFHFRESKKVAKIIYTGAQGGGQYEIEIIK